MRQAKLLTSFFKCFALPMLVHHVQHALQVLLSDVLPGLYVFFNVGHLTTMEDGTLNAIALLLAIVIQQEAGLWAQLDNGNKVAKGDAAHEEITQAPYQVETGQ